MRKMTTISFEGSAEDKRRIALLSTITDTPVGTLVKQAMDTVYGNQLNRVDELAAIFYANRSTSTKADVRDSKHEGR